MEQNVMDQNVSYTNKQFLPNSTAVLVLGIISLVFSFCCWTGGLIGIILGIIALTISAGPLKLYNENPMQYEGIGNLKAGRIMSIIALCLSSLYFIILIIYISIVGFAAFSFSNILNSIQ